jgi:pre-mRNA-processing factor 17
MHSRLALTSPQDPNAPTALITRPTDKVMNVNISYDDMMRPTLGPENPFDTRKNKGMNSVAGHVEEQSMDASTFLQQHRTFSVHGYALNPSALATAQSSIVGDIDAAAAHNFAMIENMKGTHASRRELKRRRQATGDVGVVDGEGAYVGPWGGWAGDEEVDVEVEEDMSEWREEKRRREEASAAAKERMKKAGEEKSIFHGKSLTDYAGRTYMHIPTDLGVNLRPSEDTPAPESFIPQACTHTWTGHTKAVSAVRLFPQSGHLLLSGSMDTKVKVSTSRGAVRRN